MDHFDTHRTDPELILALPTTAGEPDLRIDIAAAGGGSLGKAYTGTNWIYRVRIDGETVVSGDDIRANATGMTHHQAAQLVAESLADGSTADHSLPGGAGTRARLADFADSGDHVRVYPHLITVHTRIFHPWRDGEDEPEVKTDDSDVFVVEDFQNDNGAWNHDDTEWTPASLADTAVAMLRGAHTRFHVAEASQAGPHVDGSHNPWYIAEPYVDPYSGEREESTAHLDGFTPDELRTIYAHVI